MQTRTNTSKTLGKTLCLSNGTMEFEVALDKGIRMNRLNLCGMNNIFYEQPLDTEYLQKENGWRLEGGLRLWAAPESEESYYPDNNPVNIEILQNGILLRQEKDLYTNLTKTVAICFLPDDPNKLEVSFRIINSDVVDKNIGIWAITTFVPEGKGYVSFHSEDDLINPSRFISMWKDTKLNDPRVTYKDNGIAIHHSKIAQYFKMGILSMDGLCSFDAYGQKLTRLCGYDDSLIYPDGNINIEVFMCEHMMELETLGPLINLGPGEECSRKELWILQKS